MKPEGKRMVNLPLKHSYLRSMNSVVEMKVDCHKNMTTEINPEAGQRAGKSVIAFTGESHKEGVQIPKERTESKK